MKLSILVLVIIVGAMFSSLAIAADLDEDKTKIGITELNANDHNSTRSNRGSIAAPTDTDTKTKIGITELNANDHNSTRSNRGSIAAPTDTDTKTWNQDVANLNGQIKKTKDCEPQNDTKNRDENCTESKGRNPQTGKEINIAKKKELNP